MISMERRGVVQNAFKQPFRRRPVWSVDWSDLHQEGAEASKASALNAGGKEPD